MIKYLEVPDFHYNPADRETAKIKAEAVYKAATENRVDFIALPGDLFDRPIVATDKGGYNNIRQIVKKWLSVCPVVAVEGTPSHDGKGCYSPLEDLVLTLLKPNLTHKYDREKGVDKGSTGDGHDCLLFGIPELNKKTIQAKLGLSAEQANAEAVKQLTQYVAEYIAPKRLQYKDIPAIVLMHGVVSDSAQINTDDRIIKASDIVIHTEDLEIAQIDRWSLGHLHKPWESAKICAGYAGSSSLTWGETDFIPAMNMITIEPGYKAKIDRIPYGTPTRKKIFKPLKEYDPQIAYWLYTDDQRAQKPTGHPLSKITYNEKRKETSRITKEQAANIKGLVDLFKMIDPDVTDSVLEKVETLETQT